MSKLRNQLINSPFLLLAQPAVRKHALEACPDDFSHGHTAPAPLSREGVEDLGADVSDELLEGYCWLETPGEGEEFEKARGWALGV